MNVKHEKTTFYTVSQCHGPWFYSFRIYVFQFDHCKGFLFGFCAVTGFDFIGCWIFIHFSFTCYFYFLSLSSSDFPIVLTCVNYLEISLTPNLNTYLSLSSHGIDSALICLYLGPHSTLIYGTDILASNVFGLVNKVIHHRTLCIQHRLLQWSIQVKR